MSGVQIGNVLKNHELRLRNMEQQQDTLQYAPNSDFETLKEQVESFQKAINNSTSDKVEQLENKYNDLLELFALQQKEYLELKQKMCCSCQKDSINTSEAVTETKSDTTETETTEPENKSDNTETENNSNNKKTNKKSSNITLEVQDNK